MSPKPRTLNPLDWNMTLLILGDTRSQSGQFMWSGLIEEAMRRTQWCMGHRQCGEKLSYGVRQHRSLSWRRGFLLLEVYLWNLSYTSPGDLEPFGLGLSFSSFCPSWTRGNCLKQLNLLKSGEHLRILGGWRFLALSCSYSDETLLLRVTLVAVPAFFHFPLCLCFVKCSQVFGCLHIQALL